MNTLFRNAAPWSLVFLSSLALPFSASAETLILKQGLNSYVGTADTSIFQDTSSNSSGGFSNLFLGKTKTGSPRRILIRFDLAGVLPPGATITSATLQFYTEFGRPEDVVNATLHAITTPWNEGDNQLKDGDNLGQGSPAESGDATWNHSSFSGSSWTTPGGDFNPTATASGIAGFPDSYFQLSSPGMVIDLQAWLANPATNYGWLIKGENASGNAKRYYSSEATDPRKPTLFIEYVVGPASAKEWQRY